MKKYYIIRPDGSSIFKLPYSEDFIFHCLIKLLDTSDEQYKLLSFSNAPSDVTLLSSDTLTSQYSAINFGVWYDFYGSVSPVEC